MCDSLSQLGKSTLITSQCCCHCCGVLYCSVVVVCYIVAIVVVCFVVGVCSNVVVCCCRHSVTVKWQ